MIPGFLTREPPPFQRPSRLLELHELQISPRPYRSAAGAPWLPAFQWQIKIAVIAGDGLKEQKSLGGNNYVELCLVGPDFCLRLSNRLSLPLEERWVSHTEPERKGLPLHGCTGILEGKSVVSSLWAGTKDTARQGPCTRAPGSCRVLSELLLLCWSPAFLSVRAKVGCGHA